MPLTWVSLTLRDFDTGQDALVETGMRNLLRSALRISFLEDILYEYIERKLKPVSELVA